MGRAFQRVHQRKSRSCKPFRGRPWAPMPPEGGSSFTKLYYLIFTKRRERRNGRRTPSSARSRRSAWPCGGLPILSCTVQTARARWPETSSRWPFNSGPRAAARAAAAVVRVRAVDRGLARPRLAVQDLGFRASRRASLRARPVARRAAVDLGRLAPPPAFAQPSRLGDERQPFHLRRPARACAARPPPGGLHARARRTARRGCSGRPHLPGRPRSPGCARAAGAPAPPPASRSRAAVLHRQQLAARLREAQVEQQRLAERHPRRSSPAALKLICPASAPPSPRAPTPALSAYRPMRSRRCSASFRAHSGQPGWRRRMPRTSASARSGFFS